MEVVAAAPVVVDVAVSVADVVVPAVDVAASEEVVAVELVPEVASVVDEVLPVGEVLPVDVVVDEVLPEAAVLLVDVADVVVDVVAESLAPEVVPTLSSSLTDTPVSLSPKARRCSSSPRISLLASRSTERSAFPLRRPVPAQTAPLPRLNTVSGTHSDLSLPLVCSVVSTTSTLRQARRCFTSVLPAVPRSRTLPMW